MAALTLADELTEVKERLGKIEPELANLQEANVAAADRAKATQSAITAALNASAERIEGITRRLNQTVPAADVPIG
jgi:cell division protein ZapA